MTSFLPPHLLERLGGLDLIARTVVQGFVAGTHRTPRGGAGDEFVRHRSYQQGDDLRRLDWKLFARTDRLYVREFREASNLRAFLVVDASLSMGYADGAGLTKLRYSVILAAALGFLMLGGGDAVGLAAIGASPELRVPARSRRGQLREILLQLDRLQPAGSGDSSAVLDRVGEAMQRRGRVVLLSDLLDDADALVTALGRLRARGDEVIVLRVLTPEESGERSVGAGRFFDPERPAQLIPAAPAADPGYRRRVEDFYTDLATRLGERGVEYVPLTTALPVEQALLGWLRSRRG